VPLQPRCELTQKYARSKAERKLRRLSEKATYFVFFIVPQFFYDLELGGRFTAIAI
jgi:hypothetical protein